MTIEEKAFAKKYFEANFLDGQDVDDCGKAMIAATECLKAINEVAAQLLAAQKEEVIEKLEGLKVPQNHPYDARFISSLELNAKVNSLIQDLSHPL